MGEGSEKDKRECWRGKRREGEVAAAVEGGGGDEETRGEIECARETGFVGFNNLGIFNPLPVYQKN